MSTTSEGVVTAEMIVAALAAGNPLVVDQDRDQLNGWTCGCCGAWLDRYESTITDVYAESAIDEALAQISHSPSCPWLAARKHVASAQ
jgi:hypothetical protein